MLTNKWGSNLTPETAERISKTLFIDRESAECGNCGQKAMLNETFHDTLAGWNYKEHGGCGQVWKYVSSNYIGMDERAAELRSDLEFWPIIDSGKDAY